MILKGDMMEKYTWSEIIFYVFFPSLMMICFYIGGFFYTLGIYRLALIYIMLGFISLLVDFILGLTLNKKKDKIHHPRNKKYYKRLDKDERRKYN